MEWRNGVIDRRFSIDNLCRGASMLVRSRIWDATLSHPQVSCMVAQAIVLRIVYRYLTARYEESQNISNEYERRDVLQSDLIFHGVLSIVAYELRQDIFSQKAP